jgi:hypothetical protein
MEFPLELGCYRPIGLAALFAWDDGQIKTRVCKPVEAFYDFLVSVSKCLWMGN